MALKLLGRILLVTFVAQAVAKPIEIKTIGPQMDNDPSHDYFVELLSQSLAATEETYGKAEISFVPHATQGRAISLMTQDQGYDVVWTAATEEREQNLIKVSHKLMNGGLGWRGLIIAVDRRKEFARLQGLPQLKRYIACVGRHWPDADILEQQGLPVLRVDEYTAMYEMISLRRCDYLPLSVFEGHAELAAQQDEFPNLMFSTDTLLMYNLNMHFYVRKSQSAIAERIEQGISSLKQQGWFDSFIRSHELTRHAFPLTKFDKSNKIYLAITEEPTL